MPPTVIYTCGLGGMTLTAVEMLFAFLIDFPLAALASMVICWVIDAC